jgi:hypothetical protein
MRIVLLTAHHTRPLGSQRLKGSVTSTFRSSVSSCASTITPQHFFYQTPTSCSSFPAALLSHLLVPYDALQGEHREPKSPGIDRLQLSNLMNQNNEFHWCGELSEKLPWQIHSCLISQSSEKSPMSTNNLEFSLLTSQGHRLIGEAGCTWIDVCPENMLSL